MCNAYPCHECVVSITFESECIRHPQHSTRSETYRILADLDLDLPALGSAIAVVSSEESTEEGTSLQSAYENLHVLQPTSLPLQHYYQHQHQHQETGLTRGSPEGNCDTGEAPEFFHVPRDESDSISHLESAQQVSGSGEDTSG